MDLTRILCIALLALTTAACAGTASPTWKEHPYLFIERSEVPGIKAKAERLDWAQHNLDALKERADQWLDRKIEIPPSTGRHSVTYVCPACMEPLKTLSPTQHQCPKCQKVYSGLPYDARLYSGQHDALASTARDLGLATLFFGNKAYARKSLRILLAYADVYDGFSLIDSRGGQSVSAAKVSDQTLNEAIWLIDMAWAYDLVLGAGVGTPEERTKVEGLLRKSAATVERYNPLKSNWQTWHNAGLISVALCLQDEKLLDKVLNGDGGFFYQMENSVLSDGAWYEGSWSYHSYTLSAMLRIAEAAWHSGIDLYKAPELKKMFEAPFKCTMPNGKAPATNDGLEQGPGTAHCEAAAARYGDPVFEDFVARMPKRAGYDALFIGLENPKRHPNALSSGVMDASGLALLRRGEQFVSLDFGPHGGGHGHLDKLAVNLFTLGQTVAPDPGRGWPYNLPIHKQWYKMTLSHNTVTVDETPQKECEGKLESHDFSRDYHTATASVDTAYDGVTLRRTIALGDTWLLDIYEVESDAEHTYDWVWHGRGAFATALPNAPADMKFSQPSYSYLSNLRKGDGSKDWRATWTLPGGDVHALFKGSAGRDAILCDAPDNPRTDTLHSVILRDRAKRSVFVSLFSTKPMDWKDLPPELQEKLSGVRIRSRTLDIPEGRPEQVTISLTDARTPAGDEKCRLWPNLATDIITQARFRLEDGRLTDWQPRNLLRGGDMADSDADGIPDWVGVMRLRESGNILHADTSVSDWQPPVGDYWHGKTADRGRFADKIEHPSGAEQSLRLTRGTSDGQDCAAMRLDLVPPDTDLTVCGWTKCDLGDATSMGVMSRFHEFDTAGNRINKYVLLGDDDFHQPSGRSEWRWRALSFRSLPDTTFLNLYPIRMIAAQGQAWAANYEVRLGSVFSDWDSKRAIFREDFESFDGWNVSGPAEGEQSLVLTPQPMKVVTATQKKPVEVEPGKLYAFRIAMQNDVPAHYDPTHQAWMSAYLEFLGKDMKFLDYCKVMAFRSTLDRPVGAAMHAPEGSRYARFMLVASHISYGDREGMDGPMRATFDSLQLEESGFDPTFTPRPDGPISLPVPDDATKIEIRSFLLSREKHLSPSFPKYDVEWE